MKLSKKLAILGGSLLIGCLLFLAAFFLLHKAEVPKIAIETTNEGGYVLLLNGKPTLLKGISYNPTPIGKGYDYKFYLDEAKPWLIDGPLMKKLGINCIRIYATDVEHLDAVKQFISDMYEQFGIYTIVSDWLGLWDSPGANYADPEFRKRTKERVLTVVEALKDTEGVLIWNLGNENNYTFSGKIGFWTSPEIEEIGNHYEKIMKKAEIYYTFVDEIAAGIKEIDPVHPIALGNGEASFLQIAAKVCDNIDLLGIIIYRGKKFGNLFDNIRNIFDKPVLLSEFGCDSYNAFKDTEDQDIQATFLMSQWKDLYENTPFSGNKKGNCIGGVIFEWADEWWKHDEGYTPNWKVHNTEAGWSNGSYYFDIRVPGNMNMNEEWFGIVSIDQEIEGGVNKRIPKKSYQILKDYFIQLDEDNPYK